MGKATEQRDGLHITRDRTGETFTGQTATELDAMGYATVGTLLNVVKPGKAYIGTRRGETFTFKRDGKTEVRQLWFTGKRGWFWRSASR